VTALALAVGGDLDAKIEAVLETAAVQWILGAT
jgi:hypothetical protein